MSAFHATWQERLVKTISFVRTFLNDLRRMFISRPCGTRICQQQAQKYCQEAEYLDGTMLGLLLLKESGRQNDFHLRDEKLLIFAH